MGWRTEYIDSLDIPDSDRELLHRFEYEDWANIIPERCVSETAREEARIMARRARFYEECSLDRD